MPQGTYWQHFIFFITRRWAQEATVLRYIRLEQLAKDKHSSLLYLFVIYDENEVLGIPPPLVAIGS